MLIVQVIPQESSLLESGSDSSDKESSEDESDNKSNCEDVGDKESSEDERDNHSNHKDVGNKESFDESNILSSTDPPFSEDRKKLFFPQITLSALSSTFH